MVNKFRLNSGGMFERPEENDQQMPLRIVFLSVEGNVTESNYFKYIEKYRDVLNIKKSVHVHALSRAKNDNLSAPDQVLELLEEYVEIRNSDILPQKLKDLIPSTYSDEFLKQYLENQDAIDEDLRKDFESHLYLAGIDLDYAWFLKEYSGEFDKFGVVVDRDYRSHTVKQLNKVWEECKKKNYEFFIINPCIEFWLLCHILDVKDIYKDRLSCFRDNKSISENHNFTSKELSFFAEHAKKISEEKFKEYYLHNIDYAINQIKTSFSTDIKELIGTNDSKDSEKRMLGSNLPKLFELLREDFRKSL